MPPPMVVLSCEDYVESRIGSAAVHYDRRIAEASSWPADLLQEEMYRRAFERNVDIGHALLASLRGLPNQCLAISREIMRERYDTELATPGTFCNQDGTKR